MKKITREQIKGLRLPVPPVGIQDHISKQLAERMVSISILQAALEAEKKTIDSIPGRLLKVAFQGGQ